MPEWQVQGKWCDNCLNSQHYRYRQSVKTRHWNHIHSILETRTPRLRDEAILTQRNEVEMPRYWRGPNGRKTGLLKSTPGLLDLRSILMLNQTLTDWGTFSYTSCKSRSSLSGLKRKEESVKHSRNQGLFWFSCQIIEWGHSVMCVATHQFIHPLDIYYLVLCVVFGEVLRSV